MKIYTIGFTKKSAEEFFNILKRNHVDVLIDIRLNNKSQLSGFAKGRDLEYFLRELCSIDYKYEPQFAPTDDILSKYKKNEISWSEYEEKYRMLMLQRNAEKNFVIKYKGKSNNVCFLCSEDTPEHCHRRLLADYLKEYAFVTGVEEIIHI